MNKQEIIDFLNSEETYNKVLELINNECQLDGTHINVYPPEYFIAGGSVANTIYFLLNEHKFQKPVINDVDFFSFEENINIGLLNNGEGFINVGINKKPQLDGYGGVWFGSLGEHFTMLSSEREGVVNKITINVKQHTVKGLDFGFCYKTTIENFDLNCCEAGLDRLNKRIVYTDNFVWFLMNHKIEVTNTKTPVQSTVRIHNKTKELKTDDSGFLNEVSLLQHSFYTIVSNWNIGPIWKEKLKQHTNLIEQFYEVNESMMESIFYEGMDVYMPKEIDLKLNIDEIVFNEKSLLFFWDLFVRGKNDLLRDKLLKFYEVIGVNPLKSHSTPNIILFDNNYTKTISPINYLNSMTDLDVSVDDLIKVNEFFVKIQNDMPLVDVIQMFKLDNIQDQIKFIEFINSVIKDEFNDFSYNKFFNLIRTNSMYPSILNCLRSEKLKDKLEFFKNGSVNTLINPRIKYHHI